MTMSAPSLEPLWHEFSDRLGRFIRGRVADPAAAEDLLHEVFVKIQARLGQLREADKLESWIFRIARRAVIDHHRARREAVLPPERLAEAAGGEADPAVDEPGEAEREALLAVLRRLIDTLPSPSREALVLTEFEGLTQQALADRLGIGLSGAKSRVQRARDQLRRRLEACCTFAFDRRGRLIDCAPKARSACGECG